MKDAGSLQGTLLLLLVSLSICIASSNQSKVVLHGLVLLQLDGALLCTHYAGCVWH
jgi:hypothetical protein